MQKMKIYQYAMGCRSEETGDAVLGYTEGAEQLMALCKGFCDSSYTMDPSHATFLAFYSQRSNRYVMLHIQPQKWVFWGGQRKYPYRAAFEIERSEYATRSLWSIVGSLPRLADADKGPLNRNAEVVLADGVAPRGSREAECLASHIMHAMLSGRLLFIELDGPLGEEAKDDGIFSMPPLQLLVQAIDLLPKDLRAFATFSFLADQNHAEYLAEVPIHVVLKGGNLAKPANAYTKSLSEVLTQAVKVDERGMPLFRRAAGREPLPALSVVYAQLSAWVGVERLVALKQYAGITQQGWQMWLDMGNSLGRLDITSWDTYESVRANLPSSLTRELANRHAVRLLMLHPEAVEKAEREIDDGALWNAENLLLVWRERVAQKKSAATLSDAVRFASNLSHLSLDLLKRLDLEDMELGDIEALRGSKLLGEDRGKWLEGILDRHVTKRYPCLEVRRWGEYSHAPACVRTRIEATLRSLKAGYDTECQKTFLGIVSTMDEENRKPFVTRTKPFVEALCVSLLRHKKNAEARRLKDVCRGEGAPRRRRYVLVGVAALAGVLLGVLATLAFTPSRSGDSAVAEPVVYVPHSDSPTMYQLAYMQGGSYRVQCADSCYDFPAQLALINRQCCSGYAAGDSVRACLKRGDGGLDTVSLTPDFTLLMALGDGRDSLQMVLRDNKVLMVDNDAYREVESMLPVSDKSLAYYFWLVRFLQEKASFGIPY